MVWKLSLEPIINIPSSVNNGWDEQLKPIRCDDSPAHDLLLTSCGCKKSGCKDQFATCKCTKSGLRCADLCICVGYKSRDGRMQSDGYIQDDDDGEDSSEEY